MENAKLTLNVDELAAKLDIGINQAYALARSKGFPSLRVGKRWLVPVRELDIWLSEQTRTGEVNERV